MSIGSLQVSSSLGEPLRVRIAVAFDPDATPDIGCFRLVGPSSHSGILANAHFDLIGVDDKRYLEISTPTPAEDPIVDLTLRTEGCGPTIQKAFVVLLSPKEINAALPQPAPAPVAAATPSASDNKTAAPPRPRPAANALRRPHRKAAKMATRAARATYEPIRRRVSAGPQPAGQFVLKLDYSFGSLAQYADQVARQRQLVQNANQPQPSPTELNKAIHAAPAPSVQTGQTNQGDKLLLQPADQAIADRYAEAQNQASHGNGIAPSQSPASNGTATAGGQTGLGGSSAIPKKQTASGPAWLGTLFSPFNLIALVLLLLAGLLLGLWLKGRKPRSRFLDKSAADDLSTMLQQDSNDHSMLGRNPPSVDEVFAEPEAARTLLSETYVPNKPAPAKTPEGPASALYAPKMGEASDFTVEQCDTTDQILELAEVMLAFGRSKQAIDTLSHYIRDNAHQSIEPWLKLLDLYHDTGARDEFEALAKELHKHFNVVIAEWQDFEALTGRHLEHGSLTLDALPHVMDRLTSMWSTPACLGYLDKLLADNRGGQRQGFSLPIVRDILLLRDILRQSSADLH